MKGWMRSRGSPENILIASSSTPGSGSSRKTPEGDEVPVQVFGRRTVVTVRKS